MFEKNEEFSKRKLEVFEKNEKCLRKNENRLKKMINV